MDSVETDKPHALAAAVAPLLGGRVALFLRVRGFSSKARASFRHSFGRDLLPGLPRLLHIQLLARMHMHDQG